MKIHIVLGTRPEIIKMAPVIRECARRKVDYSVLHTGQHYNYEMDRIFFDELGLDPESVNLNIGSGSHGEVTAKMLVEIEKILIAEKPDAILVQGDTNTVLAAALAAVKLHIAVGHVEAGLRSYDKRQPEEYNRILTDHMSDFLFAPTKEAQNNLLRENIDVGGIYLTGNTIVDSVEQAVALAQTRSTILDKLGLGKKGYFLVTAHREENVDNKESLAGILNGLKMISDRFGLPMIFPIHPRTKKKITEFGFADFMEKIANLRLLEPVGFFDFLMLESNAIMSVTDSGGIVEEACILRVPLISMRKFTDRPESISAGASILAGCDPDRIMAAAEIMLAKKADWENPFGDGQSAKKIIDVLESSFKK